MTSLARWVLVFDYESWDPDTGEMHVAELPATLDAIKSGLGRPVLASGRKVLAEWIDSHGVLKRDALLNPKSAAPQSSQGDSR